MRQIIQTDYQKSNIYFSSATTARSVTTPIEPPFTYAESLSDWLYPKIDPAIEYQASLLPTVRSLSKLNRRLFLYLDEAHRNGVSKPDWSLEELGRRFHRHSKSISRALCQLEDWGFIDSQGGFQTNKQRWITLPGRRALEIHRHLTNKKMRSLGALIPYIDLSEPKVKEKNITFEAPQNCGQLDTQVIEKQFLTHAKEVFSNIPSIQEHTWSLIATIMDAALTLNDQIALFNRVVAYSLKNFIKKPLGFVKTCVRNAEKKYRAQIALQYAHLKRKDLVPYHAYTIDYC